MHHSLIKNKHEKIKFHVVEINISMVNAYCSHFCESFFTLFSSFIFLSHRRKNPFNKWGQVKKVKFQMITSHIYANNICKILECPPMVPLSLKKFSCCEIIVRPSVFLLDFFKLNLLSMQVQLQSSGEISFQRIVCSNLEMFFPQFFFAK